MGKGVDVGDLGTQVLDSLFPNSCGGSNNSSGPGKGVFKAST